MTVSESGLQLTGERTVPGIREETYWFTRHEAAYRWVCRTFIDAIGGGIVVDAGSGEGYGAAMIADAGAAVVIALEYDEAAVAHARRVYPQVRSVRANLASFPLPDDGVDAVVTMQVIEHLWDLAGFWRECRRVLRPGGLLIAATPNRRTFSPGLGRGEKPTNPFHVEEFDAEQLLAMGRAAGFRDVGVAALHHGPRIAAWESVNGSVVAAQIDAVLSGRWPEELADFVASLTAADFEIDAAPDSAADLILIGRAP